MCFHQLDWNRMWQEARRKKSWRRKGKDDWSKRAAGFAARTEGSSYADSFLALMNPASSWRVLDMGCGPGTLALPLARMVSGVTAVDFSHDMLEILRQKAEGDGLRNLRTVECSWSDDWQKHGIGVHDAAIASRSLAVDDLRDALTRLDRVAEKAVFLTDRVGATPFDAQAFAAVGRTFEPGPDYIYTVNLLYQMGITAKVDFITLERQDVYDTVDDAVASYSWMLDRLSPEEMKKLQRFVKERTMPTPDGKVRLHRDQPARWAFISWHKE